MTAHDGPTHDGLGNLLVPAALYYVQDTRGQVGNCALFWAKNSAGYCCDLAEAGLYTGERVATMRETDIAWPVAYIQQHTVVHVRVEALHRTKQAEHEALVQRAVATKMADPEATGPEVGAAAAKGMRW